MKKPERAILAIDEGTSGTRAALVFADGTVSEPVYAALSIYNPKHGVVEQDAEQILNETINVCRKQIASAREANIEIVAMALTTQRATAVLWDLKSGRPLVPAIVWQDGRYATELEVFGTRWNKKLTQNTGRPIAGRSHYYWVMQQIKNNENVRKAFDEKRLAFGTIDTWLLWNLAEGNPLYTTPTNATSLSAYKLSGLEYYNDWLDELGFPTELLAELKQDADDFGFTREDLLSIKVPIRASCGDQQASVIGLGCREVGDAMCIHGTGSFVELVAGSRKPQNIGAVDASFVMTGWRRNNKSHYVVETYTATTGSALNWICKELQWFANPEEISALASTVESSKGMIFIPSLTGLRLPHIETKARASLNGISVAHTRADLAYGILEGIAHSVNDCVKATELVAENAVKQLNAGGGVSSSSTLLQLQADLAGVPIRRIPGFGRASLRGTAFLAGAEGILWSDLKEAQNSLPEGEYFIPKISDDERQMRISHWNACIGNEMKHANQSYYS